MKNGLLITGAGFTAVEMMAVIAIIAILAMVAIPSTMGKIVKEQINAALPLTDVAKEPIQLAWKTVKVFPENNKEAGIPEPDKIVSNFVTRVEIDHGVVHLTFGNKAHKNIAGKVLSLRPAVIEESQIVPITWVCGNATAPDKMTVKGENKTNLDAQYLPFMCR